MQFSVLSSGSRGNASLVRSDGSALMIDIGIGPRVTERHLEALRVGAGGVAGVLLTHTHGDHVKEGMLAWMARNGIALHCHEGHVGTLEDRAGFDRIREGGLLKPYDDRPWIAGNGMRVEPIPLSHDDEPTRGFRVESRTGRHGPTRSLAYIADTGTWSEATADAATDVDLLGIEFNHDVGLQQSSGRPPFLVARILGDRGHLSNQQGAALLGEILKRSKRGRLGGVALLHLSDQCNRPELARIEAEQALRSRNARPGLVVAGERVTVLRVVRSRGERIAGRRVRGSTHRGGESVG